MSDLRDFTGKNRKFTGTTGERISIGTGTGDRVNEKATLRFNDTTDLLEYYNGNEWKSIDAPPIISAITVDGGADVTSGAVNIDSSNNITIEVKGSLFDSTGANVTFIGTSETLSPLTITRNSANLLTTTINAQSFDQSNEPYTVKVTNGSGLSAELADAIVADAAPVFTNAADTNFDIYDSTRGSVNIAAADLAGATDADSDTITYSIQSGSLPSGLSIASATGIISGSTSAVGTDTVSTFTVRAATTNANSDRQFTITQKAPVVTQYTSSSGTFAVPTGVTSVDVVMVAGGGGGGSGTGGGGGAGGYIDRPGFPVTPGGTISYNVGAGNPRPTGRDIGPGGVGSDSVFGTLTAKGGGGGSSGSPGGYQGPATSGGSGGGGSSYPIFNAGGASQIQTTQPGDSGNYGFGGNGITGPSGGGGGGAANNQSGYTGGSGKSSTITGTAITRGGGGRGQGSSPSPSGGAPGGGGGNQGSYGQNGGTNQGGGGGAGWDYGSGRGGSGGPGIVIVKY